MKIAIVGAGSVGTLFGSILFQSGRDVTLVEKKPEIIAAIRDSGLKISRGDDKKIIPVPITGKIEDVANPDLVLFCVKSYDNAAAAQDCLKIVAPHTLVLTLQNGIGNYEVISKIIGEERTIVGTTTFGSTQYAPGCTRSSATGDISIGEYGGGISDRIQKLAQELTEGGFIIHTVENVNSLIWTKLVVNVAINAIAALCRITNGQTYELEPARFVQKQAVDEAVAVAKALNIQVDYSALYQHAIDVTVSTSANKASMRQDVEACNPTEILAINGAVVREGEKLGIPTPVNSVLTNLVKATELGYRTEV